METNIKDMRARHRVEIKALQDNCTHSSLKIESHLETRCLCPNCGKILIRKRD